jgi:hypothetical protein
MRTGKLVAIALITGLLYGCASTEKVMIVTLPKKWLIGEYFDCFARIGSAAATLECLTVSEPEQDTHTLKVKFTEPDALNDFSPSGEAITDAQIQKNVWRCQIVQDQDSKEYSLNCSPAETPAAAPTAVLTPPAIAWTPPAPPATPLPVRHITGVVYGSNQATITRFIWTALWPH